MKFPSISFLKKEEKENLFLILLFKKEVMRAILLQEIDSSIKIVATKEEKIDIGRASVEDLIVAGDKIVSDIELSVPEGKTLEDTIFAVPYSWIDEGKVKKEKLDSLKKLSLELALKPMGFVISIEAIISFIKKKDGVPVTAIFVEESKDSITIYLSRSNNVLEVKSGRVEGKDPEVVVENLLREVKKFEILPAKMVLLHSDGIENIQQKFLSHHWTRELPFLHLPQVVILEKGFENEAIVNGVANQMGFRAFHEVEVSKEEEVEDEAHQVSTSTSKFGFLKEKDIALVALEEKKEESNVDVVSQEQFFDSEEKASVLDKRKEKRLFSVFFSTLKIPSFNIPSLRFPKIGALIIPIVAGILAVVFIVLYYSFILKAEIILFTEKKEFNDSLTVIFSESDETSFEKKILSITTLTEELNGEVSIGTTGETSTGDKAEGEITIFNKTTTEKTIEKGTVVTSSNGLEFNLADEVKIASTSSFSTEITSKKIKVTAQDFGKEYNLPSNTNFTLEGVDSADLFGKNDVAFGGGTKEVIQVVSSEDLSDLENKLLNNLENELFDQLPEIGDDQEVLPIVLSSKFIKKNFNKKEDEEATDVKLIATVEFTIGVYNQENLVKFISASDDFDIPDKYVLSKEDSDVDISDINYEDDDLVATLSYRAIFKPEVDTSNLIAKIKGKSVRSAENILEEVEEISSVKILMGNIPILPRLLPFKASRITIGTRVED